jgi:hypothetical protein
LSSRLIYLWLAAFVALGIVYDSVTPIFEAGDELFHYPYIKHIANGQGLPLQDPTDMQAWRQEGSQPPLYYMLAALATAWLDTGDSADRLRHNPHAIIGLPDYASNDNRNMIVHTPAEFFPYERTTLAVHFIRWLSMLMGIGTIFATYKIALRITGREATSLLAAALVAFNPMFAFLSAAVNNDNLVILLSTISLWQMLRIWQDGIKARRVLLLGVLVGLACLSKISAIGLVGLGGLLLTVKAWPGGAAGDPPNRLQFAPLVRRLAGSYALFLATVVLLSGWWYVRNFILYGDPTGLNRMLAIVGTRQGTPDWLPLLTAEIEGMRLSEWGLFGGVNILAAPWVYGLLNTLLSALTILGLALLVVRFFLQLSRTKRSWGPLPHGASAFGWLVLWLVVIVFAWIRWTLVTPATQGRLIFPAISTLALAMALGIMALIDLLPSVRRHAYALSELLSICLFAIALRVALVDIAPSYIPAPLAAQSAASQEPLRFGDFMSLLDSQIGAVHDDHLSVTVTWQALSPMPTDYSVFVHVLDAGELIIGQRDTYPGLGLRPTSQLRPGDVVRDTYDITLDPSALRPSEPQVRVGVYDFVTSKRLVSAQGDNPTIGSVALPARSGGIAPNPVTYHFETYFTLSGYQIDRVTLAANDSLSLTLYWRVDGPSPKDYSIFTHILGQQDALWGQVDRQLPTTTWQPGQVIRDTYVIPIKPGTPPEVYEIEVGAYDLSDGFKRLNIWGGDRQFVGNRLLLRKIRVVGK